MTVETGVSEDIRAENVSASKYISSDRWLKNESTGKFSLVFRNYFETRALISYAMIVCQSCIIAIFVAFGIFDYAAETLNPIAFSLGMLAALAFVLRRIEIRVAPDVIEIVSLLMALMIITPLCTIVLASANLPMADPMLQRLDRIVFPGFEREQIEMLPRYNA